MAARCYVFFFLLVFLYVMTPNSLDRCSRDRKRGRGKRRMETDSRKRGREAETTESSEPEPDHIAKKLEVEKGDGNGCCGGGVKEDEAGGGETGRGVFDFPWLKGEGEGGGVMTEEEWKATAAAEEEDTFMGTLGRCCGEREEVGMEGGTPLLEDNTSSSNSSLSLVDLEEGVSLEAAWDSGDGFWTSLLH